MQSSELQGSNKTSTGAKDRGFGWGAVIIWTVATTLGWGVFFFLDPIPVKDSYIGADGVITLAMMVENSLGGLLGGFIMGTGQWLGFRRHQQPLPNYASCIGVTITGLILGGLLIAFLHRV